MSYLQKRIVEKFPDEKIKVLSYSSMKEPATVKCLSCNTIYTLQKGENFVRKSKRCICQKCINNYSGGRLDIQTFQEKINKKYPNESLEVLEYTTKNKQCSIRCKKCNTIITLENAESFMNRDKVRVCFNCIKNKSFLLKDTFNLFMDWIKEQDSFDFNNLSLDDIGENGKTLYVARCIKCGRKTSKTMYDYMRDRGCGHCKKNIVKDLQDFQKEIGEEYSVIEYNGMNHRGKFKHNLCGFIYQANPRGYNCPKCKGSKGEKRIRYFLSKNNFLFEEQKTWEIEGHLLRTDFYLPDRNLVIEYNGEQHFRPINFFGGEETFKKQIYYDSLKKNFFKDNMLSISYLDYENIEKILETHLL